MHQPCRRRPLSAASVPIELLATPDTNAILAAMLLPVFAQERGSRGRSPGRPISKQLGMHTLIDRHTKTFRITQLNPDVGTGFHPDWTASGITGKGFPD